MKDLSQSASICMPENVGAGWVATKKRWLLKQAKICGFWLCWVVFVLRILDIFFLKFYRAVAFLAELLRYTQGRRET